MFPTLHTGLGLNSDLLFMLQFPPLHQLCLHLFLPKCERSVSIRHFEELLFAVKKESSFKLSYQLIWYVDNLKQNRTNSQTVFKVSSCKTEGQVMLNSDNILKCI